VLTMDEVKYLKHLYENEGESLRNIAKRMDINFRTAQKYAYQKNWSPENLPQIYPNRYSALADYLEIIDGWLEQDQREPRKQRHTATRIHKRLQEEHGFTGGYGSVKRYVRKKKYLMQQEQAAIGFLPLEQRAAHAQIDFGNFEYCDAGGKHEGHALVVTFPYSNAGWMQVFPSENQECLLEGLKRIFAHIGGVPVRVRADNMTTAVVQILEGTERVVTEGFRRFMLHYRFEADFCNPNSGNEKGNVENKVGYTRRNLLVPVPTIEDFESFNAELLARCDADHDRLHYKHRELISERWAEEKERLLTLPQHEYEVFRYEALAVNKYGFVTVDTNKYGLSPELSGAIAQAKIFFDRLEFYYDHQLLKTYPRNYGRNQEVLDWTQYVGALCKKPGGATDARFFDQMPRLWREHLQNTKGKERKTALLVLREIVRDGNEGLCDDALAMASEYGKPDADSIRQCYYLISKEENHPKPLVFSAPTPELNYRPDLAVYDNLAGGKVQ